MPAVLRIGSFQFAIFTHEHEPPHVHVRHPDGTIVVVLDEESQTARLRSKTRRVKPADARVAVHLTNVHFAKLLTVWEKIHRQNRKYPK